MGNNTQLHFARDASSSLIRYGKEDMIDTPVAIAISLGAQLDRVAHDDRIRAAAYWLILLYTSDGEG